MQLALDQPFVFEFVDRTRSSRPPREALSPAAEPAPLLGMLMALPSQAADMPQPRADLGTLIAFWGD